MRGWECQLRHEDPHGNEAAAAVSVVYSVLNFIAVGFWVVMITYVFCVAGMSFREAEVTVCFDRSTIIPSRYSFSNIVLR